MRCRFASKDTLDVCFLPADGRPRSRSFANDPAGHVQLVASADAQARGAPPRLLPGEHRHLRHRPGHHPGPGRYVSVLNPARIKYAGLARGQGNKTDKAEARCIAGYARELPPLPAARRTFANSSIFNLTAHGDGDTVACRFLAMLLDGPRQGNVLASAAH
jgi:hypothetical protein